MKTFLLDAYAPYTQGTMLIVYESIEQFRQDFIAYHKRKLTILGNLPYYLRTNINNQNKWLEDIQQRDEEERNFVKSESFCFEIDCGTRYIKKGFGKGNFKDDIFILFEPSKNKDEEYWLVVKEFQSDLPKGIHYNGEYCA